MTLYHDHYAHAQRLAVAMEGNGIERGGYFSCKCPAHEGKGNTSLWLRSGDDGIAYGCFGGCEAKDIAAAVEKATGSPINDPERKPSMPDAPRVMVHELTPKQKRRREFARQLWGRSMAANHHACPVHLWAQQKVGWPKDKALDPNIRWLMRSAEVHAVIVPISSPRSFERAYDGEIGYWRQIPPSHVNAVQLIGIDMVGNQVPFEWRGKLYGKQTWGPMQGGVFAIGDTRGAEVNYITEGAADLLGVIKVKGAAGFALMGTAGFKADAQIVSHVYGRDVVIYADSGEAGLRAAWTLKKAMEKTAHSVKAYAPKAGADDPAEAAKRLREQR